MTFYTINNIVYVIYFIILFDITIVEQGYENFFEKIGGLIKCLN